MHACTCDSYWVRVSHVRRCRSCCCHRRRHRYFIGERNTEEMCVSARCSVVGWQNTHTESTCCSETRGARASQATAMTCTRPTKHLMKHRGKRAKMSLEVTTWSMACKFITASVHSSHQFHRSAVPSSH